MGDYKTTSPRAKKQEHIRKLSKDLIITQKPKKKTRLSSPEIFKNSSSPSSQSKFGISLQSKVEST